MKLVELLRYYPSPYPEFDVPQNPYIANEAAAIWLTTVAVRYLLTKPWGRILIKLATWILIPQMTEYFITYMPENNRPPPDEN